MVFPLCFPFLYIIMKAGIIMKVSKLTAIRTLEIAEEAIPEIKNAKDVQVKVKAVGICGTDLHIFEKGRADVQLPRVLGHELSGEVTEVGSGVTRVKVGDRVVLDPVFSCGVCRTCAEIGAPNVCDNVKCYGVQMDGGYREYIVEDETHFYTIPENTSYEEAALAEPFSIAANILDRCYATEKDTILVIGAGTIGLSIVQAAKCLGAKVMVSDVVDRKIEKAKEMGADRAVNSKKEDLAAASKEIAPIGFSVVIDAVGVTPLFQQSLNFAAPRARVACIGFDEKPAEISPIVVTKKELSIIGSRMNCHQFPKVMEWLRDGKLAAEKMISRKYQINDIQKAFEETLENTESGIKTLILF